MTLDAVQIGTVLAGRYRIDRELGAGGMGIVYAAWHMDLDQPVAVKVLVPPVNDLVAATKRFRREVRAAARIQSEHVARVFDVGSLASGLPYMVLELLNGNDLEVELQNRGTLPIPLSVTYVLQAIEALAEAHAAGIVHRDLKPANLFLATRPDHSRIIKVLDFGISKSLLSDSSADAVSLTQTGMVMGSPLYMSPEQMRSSRDVDSRTDIWALGVILHQLVAGSTPYYGASVPELCAVLFRDPPRRLTASRLDAPPELERVVLRCLARDPANRYQTVGELARDLVGFAPEARVHCERAVRVLGGVAPGRTPHTGVASVGDQPSHGGPPWTAQSVGFGPARGSVAPRDSPPLTGAPEPVRASSGAGVEGGGGVPPVASGSGGDRVATWQPRQETLRQSAPARATQAAWGSGASSSERRTVPRGGRVAWVAVTLVLVGTGVTWKFGDALRLLAGAGDSTESARVLSLGIRPLGRAAAVLLERFAGVAGGASVRGPGADAAVLAEESGKVGGAQEIPGEPSVPLAGPIASALPARVTQGRANPRLGAAARPGGRSSGVYGIPPEKESPPVQREDEVPDYGGRR